jgi:hypothetical protein
VFDRSFNGASFDAHDGPVRCCRAVPRSSDCQTVADTRRMVGSCWLCGAHRTRAAAAACETRGNPDRGMSSSAFHTTSQRPAYVALYDPHSQPLEAPVQLSGLPRVFVHALAFSSTPSHADAAEFSSTPSHAAATHALCALSTTRLVCCNCLTVVAPRHGAAAPHRAVMGIKRRPVERPVEHACPEAPRAPRN